MANKHITVAAVDLGSNTFRLLVSEVCNGKLTEVRARELKTVRLGEGLNKDSKISRKTITSAIDTLKDFVAITKLHQVQDVRCCGTEALRRAANSDHFVCLAKEATGLNIEIVTGLEEAYLNCVGVLSSINDQQGKSLLICDVGGASTEITHVNESGQQDSSISLASGAVSFTDLEKSGLLLPAKNKFTLELLSFVKNLGIRPTLSLIGSGGTATSLAAFIMDMSEYDPERVQGFYVSADKLHRTLDHLKSIPVFKRNYLPGLGDGRGEIIVAGLEIYQEIIATIGVEGMIVSDSGLLEGIALSTLSRP